MWSTCSPVTGTAPLAGFKALPVNVNRHSFVFNQLFATFSFSVTRYLDTIKFSSGLFFVVLKNRNAENLKEIISAFFFFLIFSQF